MMIMLINYTFCVETEFEAQIFVSRHNFENLQLNLQKELFWYITTEIIKYVVRIFI